MAEHLIPPPPADGPASSFDVVAQHAPMGFAVLDRELRYVRVNDWLAELHGVPANGHRGLRPRDLPASSWFPRASQPHLERVLATGDAVTDAAVDLPGRTLLLTARPVLEGGQVVGVGLLVRDVTAERSAEHDARWLGQQLQREIGAAESRVHDALERLPTILLVARTDGEIELVTGRYLMDGEYRPASELPGLIAPGVRAHLTAERRRIFATGRPGTYFVQLQLPDGRRRWHEVRWTPHRDALGEIVRWHGVSFDVDDRVRAEEDRDQAVASTVLAESRFRAIVATAPVGVTLWSREWRVEFANEAAAAIFGRPAHELRGMHGSALVPEGEWESTVARLREVGPSVLCEHDVLRPGGEIRHVEVRAVPVALGEDVGLLSVTIDVTESRRQAEARAAADRFRELLVGMLGHDLRSPLQSIRMTSLLLARSPAVGETERSHVARIDRAARRMTSLVDDVLTMVQSNLGGGIPLQRASVDLRDVVARVVDELASAYPEAQVAVMASGVTRARVDADRVAQVVTNLVANAVRYRAAGTPVRVRVRGGEPAVTIEVENDGPGIAGDLLPHLFDPFRRGDDAPGGVGLGLYIVRLIVDAHGGDVEASSRDGRTTFRVCLPR